MITVSLSDYLNHNEKQFLVLNHNHGKNIVDKLAQCGKTLISIFQQFSAGIKKILGLGEELSTRL